MTRGSIDELELILDKTQSIMGTKFHKEVQCSNEKIDCSIKFKVHINWSIQ